MEVAGSTVFRQVPYFSSNSNSSNTTTTTNTNNGLQSRSFFPKQQRSNRKSVVVAMAEFSDKGHLQYYNNNTSRNGIGMMMMIKEEKEMMMTSEKKKKEMKKQLKLLKGLSKNLSVFEDMGFGFNLDNNNGGGGGLDEQVRGKMISEATEVLVGQLQKLKAEKMELKRMKKEEKAKKKAAKMMMMDCKDSSSSSSSSESECEKIKVSHGETTTSSLMVVDDDKQVITEKMNINISSSSSSSLRLDNNAKNSKIEVCMGGKCKKSGAAMLLENFQKAVGVGVDQVQVVGCKCMGKCRDGPNVKVAAVTNNGNGVGGLGLCMGVRLEDVDSIVNDYLFGVAPPTAPAAL